MNNCRYRDTFQHKGISMKKLVLILFMITIWLSADDTLYSKYQKSFEQQDYLSAKNYLIKVIDITIPTNDIEKLQKLYGELANIYKIKKEFHKALEYYKLSLKLERSKKTPSKKEKLRLYRNLAFCYKQIGNTFEAFKSTYKATKLASVIYGKKSKTLKELKKDIEKIQSNLIAASIF